MKIPKARKLPSGSWNIELQLNGKRYSITERTKKECENRALMVKAEIRNGLTYQKPSSLTLAGAMQAYIDQRSNVLSPSTIQGYLTILRTRFLTAANYRLPDIKSWQMIINQEARLCSAKTLKNAWGFVKSVLKANGIEPDPVTLPQLIPKEKAFLEPEQIPMFLNAIRDDQYELIYILALHGLRRSEIFGLKVHSIQENLIRIRGSVVNGIKGRLTEKETNKNSSSRRDVPVMIPRLFELIKGEPDDLLVSRSGATILKHLHAICSAHQLPQIGLHELRHSFASLCYHLGISEAETMRLGGWSDPGVMRKIYTHLAQRDKDAAAEKLKSFFIQNKAI